MSPLALPRNLLDKWLDELIPSVDGALKDVLVQLKNRPTFAEQWPDQYEAGLQKGKARILKLEQIRTQDLTMTDILSARHDILDWWLEI